MDSRQITKPVRKLFDGYLRWCARSALSTWSPAPSWDRCSARVRYCKESEPASQLRPTVWEFVPDSYQSSSSFQFAGYSSPFGVPEEFGFVSGELQGLLDLGPFSSTTPMTLARLSDSDRLQALADLSGRQNIHASHIRSTFLGYLALCELYSIRYLVSVSNGTQCLTCLTFKKGCRRNFSCGCHNIKIFHLMDIPCYCSGLVCGCDDLPPMCLDLEQLTKIHKDILLIYQWMLHIRTSDWSLVMSVFVLQSVDPMSRGLETTTTIRLSQFEPP